MASLSVRKIDQRVYERLQARASEHGVSMEEEVRQILQEAVSISKRLGDFALECFGPENGVDLELRPSFGTVDNLQRLQLASDAIDVAFVQGGVVEQPSPDGLEALGSVFLEPLWVFVNQGEDDVPRRLSDLKGLKLAVGAEGSGTRLFVVAEANASEADLASKNMFRSTVGEALPGAATLPPLMTTLSIN